MVSAFSAVESNAKSCTGNHPNTQSLRVIPLSLTIVIISLALITVVALTTIVLQKAIAMASITHYH